MSTLTTYEKWEAQATLDERMLEFRNGDDDFFRLQHRFAISHALHDDVEKPITRFRVPEVRHQWPLADPPLLPCHSIFCAFSRSRMDMVVSSDHLIPSFLKLFFHRKGVERDWQEVISRLALRTRSLGCDFKTGISSSMMGRWKIDWVKTRLVLTHLSLFSIPQGCQVRDKKNRQFLDKNRRQVQHS